MKINDAIWGIVLMVFGGALLFHVSSFPPIPGQQVGPNVLPGAVAVGLAVCGAILLVTGLRRAARGGATRWFEWPVWVSSGPHRLAFIVLVVVNLLYLFGVQTLGFVLTGVIYLAALMMALRVPVRRALPVAIVMTLVIHYGFYKLLKVPLPWGVLQPIAW